MNKATLLITAIILSSLLPTWFLGCQSKRGPAVPYDIGFTPTPERIYGSVSAFVEDKGIGVPNVLVKAIPPSGVTVYSQSTTASGIATFNPTWLDIGNWTFVVPAQTPFPFAPSTITMPVSVANQTANFNSAGATIYLTPTVPESFTSTNPGNPFTYNLVYSQPGKLLIPGKIAFSAFPTNWNGTYAPATIGYGSADTASVTVTGVNCVDMPPSFSVTALDLEPTPYPRAYSSPQTITKGFNSTVTVSWTTTYVFQGLCAIMSGTQMYEVWGNLNVSLVNGCTSSAVVTVSWNAGDCCQNQLQTPNGTIGASNCGGGTLQFAPGSYACTITSGGSTGALNVSFDGQSQTTNIPSSGTTQLLQAHY